MTGTRTIIHALPLPDLAVEVAGIDDVTVEKENLLDTQAAKGERNGAPKAAHTQHKAGLLLDQVVVPPRNHPLAICPKERQRAGSETTGASK